MYLNHKLLNSKKYLATREDTFIKHLNISLPAIMRTKILILIMLFNTNYKLIHNLLY